MSTHPDSTQQADQEHAQQILGLQSALEEANQLVELLRGSKAGLLAQVKVLRAHLEELQRQVAELSLKVPADNETQEPT